jgi:hypothetical protein
MRYKLIIWTAVFSALLFAGPSAQTLLDTVRLPHDVLADGKPLAAGAYQVRLTSQIVEPARGEAPGSERWVEFVTETRVVGREIASVIPDAEIATVAEATPPRPGTSRVDLLKGGEYLRVWINRDGTHYIVNLPLDVPDVSYW